MRVVLELTQREADELRRAEFRLPSSFSVSSGCVVRELESAQAKLNTALDKATREATS